MRTNVNLPFQKKKEVNLKVNIEAYPNEPVFIQKLPITNVTLKL